MSLLKKGIESVFSGQLSFRQASREAFRRGQTKAKARRERAMLDELASSPVELRIYFQHLSASQLLQHFRERPRPTFFPGFNDAATLRKSFPDETAHLIESAHRIIAEHRWPLLGFGDLHFGPTIEWRRDPVSQASWELDYHGDVLLWRGDGSDIRVLWELNRLAHLVTLAQAFSLTNDEKFATEFFAQLESWREQNPLGRGPNWSCAMEVALRAMNVLAAFSMLRHSAQLTEERLNSLLTMFEQHGAHIQRNLEFSFLATSNHYLSDVAGLLWLGIMLPEVREAGDWREWGLQELLREMDKQILPDGADYEGSTGYHCFVAEVFLYAFILCRENAIEIHSRYWKKLYAMLAFIRGIVRPDRTVPLLGDTDGGSIFSSYRNADDRTFLLDIGAVIFSEPEFKTGDQPSVELAWILGEQGVQKYQALELKRESPSQIFANAGVCVLRSSDLSVTLAAIDAGSNRPSSHRHNDFLSVEVMAHGRPFVVDPGTYVYTANLSERHLFRSTAYHSTVQIDGEEQQAIRETEPFKIETKARVRVLESRLEDDYDLVTAEHAGYERFKEGVTHRRSVTLYKTDRWCLIEDELSGKGQHEIAVRFHFDAGLKVELWEATSVIVIDELTEARLCLFPLDSEISWTTEFEPQFVSRHYGSKQPSTTAKWSVQVKAPCKFRWAIVPVSADEDPNARLVFLTSDI